MKRNTNADDYWELKWHQRYRLYIIICLALTLMIMYAAIALCISLYGIGILFPRWVYWSLYYIGLVGIVICKLIVEDWGTEEIVIFIAMMVIIATLLPQIYSLLECITLL